MSEHAARSALERMNLREVAVAIHYTGLAADLRQMADTEPEEAQRKFMEHRRAELCAAYGFNEPSPQRKPFAFAQGFAIIPVSGTLINRFGASWGFVTGYNFVRSQMNQALADDDVKAIIFDLNSYGGEAAGCFELSTDIYNARGKKPLLGVIDSNCYSACYAIGSACDKLVITPSGGAGSIGVVAMHVDMSAFLEKVGLKVTFIHSGEHKVDGNPFEALPKEVKADIQAGVDKSRKDFVALVARNRNIDAKTVHDTEARTYRAEAAVDLGLVDAIASPSEAVQAFFSELSGSKTKEDESMSTQVTEPGADQQAAAQAANNQAAVDQASAEARTAERARVSGIMGCEEAKGRSQLATHLALNTDMSVDAAKGVLAASPMEAAQEPAAGGQQPNRFQQAMDNGDHPRVGADGAGGGGNDDPGEAPHLAILRDQERATGAKLIEK